MIFDLSHQFTSLSFFLSFFLSFCSFFLFLILLFVFVLFLCCLYCSIYKFVSNDVLEAEIARLQVELSTGKLNGASSADELQEKLQTANIQLTVLVAKVQSGKLTFEDYLAQLKQVSQQNKR